MLCDSRCCCDRRCSCICSCAILACKGTKCLAQNKKMCYKMSHTPQRNVLLQVSCSPDYSLSSPVAQPFTTPAIPYHTVSYGEGLSTAAIHKAVTRGPLFFVGSLPIIVRSLPVIVNSLPTIAKSLTVVVKSSSLAKNKPFTITICITISYKAGEGFARERYHASERQYFSILQECCLVSRS